MDIKDLTYDLATEILYGGFRFDQNDFAYALCGLVKNDGLDSVRDMVRKNIAQITVSKRDPFPSTEFVESQLRYWIPDSVLEEGALIGKLKDSGNMPNILTVVDDRNRIFGAHNLEVENLWSVMLIGVDGKPVHPDLFCEISDWRSYSLGCGEGDALVYGLTGQFDEVSGHFDMDYKSLVQIDRETNEVHQWAVSDVIARKCLDSMNRYGLRYEVLRSACESAMEDRSLNGDDALLIGCREYDVMPDLSKGIKI